MKITVISDTSGSMTAMAKYAVILSLIKYFENITKINNFKYSALEFQYINVTSINDFIKETKPKDRNFIFLTDGLFGQDEREKYCQINENHPDIKFVIIAIGHDADEFNIKKMTYKNRLFRPEDVSQVIDIFLSKHTNCPKSFKK